jgi:hypothetical protein
MASPEEDNSNSKGVFGMTGTDDVLRVPNTEHNVLRGPLDVTGLVKSQSASFVPIDASKVQARGLKRVESCFFKSMMEGFGSKGARTRPSVVKSRVGGMLAADPDKPNFTRAIFNPNAKFDARTQGSLFDAAQNHARR